METNHMHVELARQYAAWCTGYKGEPPTFEAWQAERHSDKELASLERAAVLASSAFADISNFNLSESAFQHRWQAFHAKVSPETVLCLITEIRRLRAECKDLGEFVITCGGFWGTTKSELVGPDSLHAVIESAFADAAELERLRSTTAKPRVVSEEFLCLAKEQLERLSKHDNLKVFISQDISDKEA